MKIIILLYVLMFNVNLQADILAKKMIGGFSVVWGFDFISDDDVLVSERNGILTLVNLKNQTKTKIKGLPVVFNEGQGGLLDIKLHPDFKKNKLIYMTYSHGTKNSNTTRLARAKLEKNELKDFKVLFTAEPALNSKLHFGSRIAFDRKGFLYFGVGERNERDNAQNLNNHLGKIIRLTEEGEVPKDNPFYGQKDKKPEIWSYGHRNPQGTFYDLETDKLWTSEHGPRGGDEINLISKGKNYGWPVITYGKEYWGPSIGAEKKEGMEQPIKMYKPSIAPSTLFIYKGDRYSGWKNSFFLGALVLEHLNRVSIKDGKPIQEQRLFENKYGRIRHVEDDLSGNIYFSTDSGDLYKLIETKDKI